MKIKDEGKKKKKQGKDAGREGHREGGGGNVRKAREHSPNK